MRNKVANITYKELNMACLENGRWERYAQFRAEGLNKEQAYTQAGYKPGSRNYTKLEMDHPEIVARIKELQNKRANKLRQEDTIDVLNKKRAAGLLTDIAKNTGANDHARIQATSLLARFYGWNSPEEHVVTNTKEMSDKQLLDIINEAKEEQKEQELEEKLEEFGKNTENDDDFSDLDDFSEFDE